MRLDAGRIRAVVEKEIREYLHNRFVIYSMAFLPIVFVVAPMISLLRIPATASPDLVRALVGELMLFVLIVPVFIPATIAAYSVIGERDQGTLEPLLTTPISREELLLGKALAAMLPAVGISYIILVVDLVIVRLAASATVASAVWQAPQILAEILFAPLLAGFAIWVGLAVSARSSDVRAAQQIGTLASLPPVAVTALISFQVITPSVLVAVLFALALVAVDVVAWFVVSAIFDRERLITGKRARADRGQG